MLNSFTQPIWLFGLFIPYGKELIFNCKYSTKMVEDCKLFSDFFLTPARVFQFALHKNEISKPVNLKA
jgi:hypothetical protein